MHFFENREKPAQKNPQLRELLSQIILAKDYAADFDIEKGQNWNLDDEKIHSHSDKFAELRKKVISVFYDLGIPAQGTETLRKNSKRFYLFHGEGLKIRVFQIRQPKKIGLSFDNFEGEEFQFKVTDRGPAGPNDERFFRDIPAGSTIGLVDFTPLEKANPNPQNVSFILASGIVGLTSFMNAVELKNSFHQKKLASPNFLYGKTNLTMANLVKSLGFEILGDLEPPSPDLNPNPQVFVFAKFATVKEALNSRITPALLDRLRDRLEKNQIKL